MKRFYVLTPVAVLLLVFLVLVMYAGRPGEDEPPGPGMVQQEQKEAGREPDTPEEVKKDHPAGALEDIKSSREEAAKVLRAPPPISPAPAGILSLLHFRSGKTGRRKRTGLSSVRQ